ncbi:MAG: 4'-phosphopantetheinyl transferase superfamily protein [Ruminiclostridium sp.]|nr:4'-phosphopantetheinyl transferase superfamily protein [Ruminiclostridium sp.]
MIEIYAIGIPEKNIQLKYFNECLQYVDKQKQVEIKRYVRHEDAQRVLMADILIRTIICGKLKIKNKEISFGSNEYGKPFLIGAENFHFNNSHSGEWVVCAIDDLPIGIDVEMIQSIDFDIAERFFSKEEYKDFLSKDESEKLPYFYDLWTLKESYIKAVGKGLSIPLDTFSIRVCDDGIKFKTKNEFKDCFFRQYNIDGSYKLAVCAGSGIFPENIIMKSCDEVCREIIKESEG